MGIRHLLAIGASGATVAAAIGGCNDNYGVLLAKQVDQGGDLVGGPAAVANVGDFLLENDQIRINILAPHDSPGPGVFGGSVVDIDLRRDRAFDADRNGRDRFAEMFPVSNLLVPTPIAGGVKVLADGSDGKAATIRVEADGGFLFEALSILQSDRPVLGVLFPDIKPFISFRTDYTLRPGSRSLEVKTLVAVLPPYTFDIEPTELEPYTGPASVFGQIFGDDVTSKDHPPVKRAGVVGGDFVFFGGQNTLFAPGIGFDTDKAVHDAFNVGKNTFETPLVYDYVAAVGGDVSYAYYTLPEADGTPTIVDVPLFTSSATAFLTGGKNCLFAKSDAACNKKRLYSYERRLAVGEGDVGSVLDEILRVRGTPVGTVKGAVRGATGEPAKKAHVYIFVDPSPGTTWASLDVLAQANTDRHGNVGLIDAIDADPGLDPVLDGDFHGTLPEGDYVLVARSADGMGISAPESFHLATKQTVVLTPTVVTPGTLQYKVSDELGQALPAKVQLIGKAADGSLLEGDGLRRVYLGEGRLGNGVRTLVNSAPGSGSLTVEPGEYLVRVSHGPEYGIFEQDVTIRSAGVARVDALIQHEVDTAGWMSADMHLHDGTSFDSGMLLDERVRSIASEGVEFAVSTDHDVETDYLPTVKSLLLDPWVKSAVGVETTTIEQGHFIGFPLAEDATIIPGHGAPDPTCESGGQILDLLRGRTDGTTKPFTIVAHPRDGFFGYIEQLGVDTYTMKRQLSSLENGNAVLQTASCDFDGIEVINGKRFDLVRTATVSEVVDYNRCRARVDAVKTVGELEGICPEYAKGMLAPCATGERILPCRDRNRSAVAFEAIKRILTRTPEEQALDWNFPKSAAAGEALCGVAQYKDKPVPADRRAMPCTVYTGQVDDFFRYIEHGMLRTPISSSDSHEGVHEPGYPRTFFKSPTDSPIALSTVEVVKSLRSGSTVTSYGPFVRASIDGKSFGEVAEAHGGDKVKLDLKVSSASWFGVDRIEIYENGLLEKVIEPKSKTSDIIDFDGKVELEVPKRDSWILIIAMGLEDRNLMRKVSLDVPFGEIQIARVTSDAFQTIPAIAAAFPASPVLPDWFPIPAYAVTNPIFIDTDGNGKYDAPLAYPAFCSRKCDAESEADSCPSGQSCIETYNQCGVDTGTTCDHRIPWAGSAP